MHMLRKLTYFRKDSDDLVGAVELSDSQFETLRELLGYGVGDAMVDCYPVGDEILRQWKCISAVGVDLTKFDCLLEAESC